MANKLNLRIVSPTKLILEKDVDMVIMRSVAGDLGVLPGHENLTTLLSVGELRAQDGESSISVSVCGGFAEVTDKSVTVLSDAAELSKDIDKDRALAAKKRAEDRLLSKDVDVKRAEMALKKAQLRIDLADKK